MQYGMLQQAGLRIKFGRVDNARIYYCCRSRHCSCGCYYTFNSLQGAMMNTLIISAVLLLGRGIYGKDLNKGFSCDKE